MLVSIDNYYSVDFYNQCLSALKNNNVQYKEYISTVGDFKWYVDIPRAPIMLNYDVCPVSEERYLVSKVITLDPDSSYKYYRRSNSYKHFVDRYMCNDVWIDIKDTTAWLVRVRSKNDILRFSDVDKNSKVYYLGRYLDNRLKMCVVSSPLIRSIIPREDVIMEKSDKIERFETDINYRVLMGKERLVKFNNTPYALNGQLYMPLYYSETDKQKFMMF